MLKAIISALINAIVSSFEYFTICGLSSFLASTAAATAEESKGDDKNASSVENRRNNCHDVGTAIAVGASVLGIGRDALGTDQCHDKQGETDNRADNRRNS